MEPRPGLQNQSISMRTRLLLALAISVLALGTASWRIASAVRADAGEFNSYLGLVGHRSFAAFSLIVGLAVAVTLVMVCVACRRSLWIGALGASIAVVPQLTFPALAVFGMWPAQPSEWFSRLQASVWVLETPGRSILLLLHRSSFSRWGIGLVNPPTSVLLHEVSLLIYYNGLVYTGALVALTELVSRACSTRPTTSLSHRPPKTSR